MPLDCQRDDQFLVDIKNIANNARRKPAKDNSDSIAKEGKGIWQAIRNIEFDFWRESHRNQSQRKADAQKLAEVRATVSSVEGESGEKKEDNQPEENNVLGGILPRTGPGMFTGLAVIGIALMALAARKR